MLHAILRGKARRVNLPDNAAQSWRSVFRDYEDLLTAAFWGRINYLSEQSLTTFLTQLIGNDVNEWGKFESLVFWPQFEFQHPVDAPVRRWVVEKDKYAEPDVVLNFENAALIIEVKPPNGEQQYQRQWGKEVYAWQKDEETNKPRLHFMAIGNLPAQTAAWFDELSAIFDGVTFHGFEWLAVRATLEQSAANMSMLHDKRVVADCLSALDLYGIRPPLRPWKPFNDFIAAADLSAGFAFIQGKQ